MLYGGREKEVPAEPAEEELMSPEGDRHDRRGSRLELHVEAAAGGLGGH